MYTDPPHRRPSRDGDAHHCAARNRSSSHASQTSCRIASWTAQVFPQADISRILPCQPRSDAARILHCAPSRSGIQRVPRSLPCRLCVPPVSVSCGQSPQVGFRQRRSCWSPLSSRNCQGHKLRHKMPGSSPADGILPCLNPAWPHPYLSSPVHHLKLPSVSHPAGVRAGTCPARPAAACALTRRSNHCPTQSALAVNPR